MIIDLRWRKIWESGLNRRGFFHLLANRTEYKLGIEVEEHLFSPAHAQRLLSSLLSAYLRALKKALDGAQARIQMPPTIHTFSTLHPSILPVEFELFPSLKLVTFIEILFQMGYILCKFSKEMSDLDLCMNFIVFRIRYPTLAPHYKYAFQLFILCPCHLFLFSSSLRVGKSIQASSMSSFHTCSFKHL